MYYETAVCSLFQVLGKLHNQADGIAQNLYITPFSNFLWLETFTECITIVVVANLYISSSLILYRRLFEISLNSPSEAGSLRLKSAMEMQQT